MNMRTVLVIDDETGITEVIEEALRMVGYEVEVACNGREGIRKFNDQPYDLVITDICMPGVNGNSVARHIRKHCRRLSWQPFPHRHQAIR